jgi:hypothetical protein
MNKTLTVIAALLLGVGSAVAESPIDGTWKIKLDTAQFSQKPDVYELKDGKWRCPTCFVRGPVVADGTDQKVTGNPMIDTLAVKVIDDRNIETTGKKGGKWVSTYKYSVGEDGNTISYDFRFISAANGQEQSGHSTAKRVGAAPKSGNQVTGQWQTEKVENVSDAMTTMTYSSSGDEVTFKAGTGESYTAKLDGKDYPTKGDPMSDMVSLKLVDDHTFQETYKKGGKPVYVSTMKVAADGKSMELTGEDKRRGTTDKVTAEKQ